MLRIGCKDRRFKIKHKEDVTTEWNITSICQWNTTYSVNPQDLECVLQFCNNATLHVNELYNYDFQWSEDDRVKLGKNIVYPCKGSMRIENSSRHKLEADQEIVVKCGEDGNFQYPEQWPQCLDDVSCGNPPIVPNFGYQIWMSGEDGSNNYSAEIYYR